MRDRLHDIIESIVKDFGYSYKIQNEDSSIPIYSESSDLDSLGLVNVLVDIEEKVRLEFDKDISIMDNRAMSQVNNPFKDVDSVVEFVAKQIDI